MFALWAPEYLKHGIPTFPVNNKLPAIRNYLNIGKSTTMSLIERFPGASAIGIPLRKSRITLVDIDTSDTSAVEIVAKQFGHSPLMVRTQSGGHHLYYKNSGEGRVVRYFDKPPIDLLGDGFAIAPPSIGPNGHYEIIRGTLHDLENLPPVHQAVVRETRLVPKGMRNVSLWRHCMAQARYCDDQETLEDVGMLFNENCHPQLSAAEVKAAAASARSYTISGKNWFGTRGMLAIGRDLRKQLTPDEMYLYLGLRGAHAGLRDVFLLTVNAGPALNMTRRRLITARDGLLAKGVLKRIHIGKHKGDPHRYRLTA